MGTHIASAGFLNCSTPGCNCKAREKSPLCSCCTTAGNAPCSWLSASLRVRKEGLSKPGGRLEPVSWLLLRSSTRSAVSPAAGQTRAWQHTICVCLGWRVLQNSYASENHPQCRVHALWAGHIPNSTTATAAGLTPSPTAALNCHRARPNRRDARAALAPTAWGVRACVGACSVIMQLEPLTKSRYGSYQAFVGECELTDALHCVLVLAASYVTPFCACRPGCSSGSSHARPE